MSFKAECLERYNAAKVTGAWDFYDIYYTSKALMQGKVNKVMKVDILHRSRGELVGRMSWHENRQAFINNVKLPLISEDKVVEEV